MAQNDVSFCEFENEAKISNSKIYLLGENHIPKNNLKVRIAFHKLLLKNSITPKYFIQEGEASLAYAINKYLNTNDTNCLNILSNDDPSFKTLVVDYRNYYQSLRDNQKFKTIGVDIERFYEYTEFAVGDILINNFSKDVLQLDSTQNQFYDLFYMVKNFKHNYIRPYMNTKDLVYDLDNLLDYIEGPDSIYLKNIIRENKEEFYEIMDSYKLSKKRNTKHYAFSTNRFMVIREEYMTKKIYEIFQNDSNAIAMGNFGSDHILHVGYKLTKRPQDKIRLGNALQNDPQYRLLNNKVNSTIIYYSSFKQWYFKRFLKTDLSMIPVLFNQMKKCKLLFININSKSADNLILFNEK